MNNEPDNQQPQREMSIKITVTNNETGEIVFNDTNASFEVAEMALEAGRRVWKTHEEIEDEEIIERNSRY